MVEQEGRAIDQGPGQIFRCGQPGVLQLFGALLHIVAELHQVRIVWCRLGQLLLALLQGDEDLVRRDRLLRIGQPSLAF